MSRSIHDKLERVRPPRVHIKYEVYTGGAMIERELPFVVGVLGDFSGDPVQPLKPLKERKFTPIDRDNFNKVLASMAPGLKLENVENTLQPGSDKGLTVNLKFTKMEDFEPGAVVNQVPALKELLETRNRLRDLLLQTSKSDKLETLVEQILQNQDELKKAQESRGAKPADEPAK